MTETKTKRTRLDWNDISDALTAATGEQCRWAFGELEIRKHQSAPWITVSEAGCKSTGTPQIAAAFVRGMIYRSSNPCTQADSTLVAKTDEQPA